MTLKMALYQDACEESLADTLYDVKKDREMLLHYVVKSEDRGRYLTNSTDAREDLGILVVFP